MGLVSYRIGLEEKDRVPVFAMLSCPTNQCDGKNHALLEFPKSKEGIINPDYSKIFICPKCGIQFRLSEKMAGEILTKIDEERCSTRVS